MSSSTVTIPSGACFRPLSKPCIQSLQTILEPFTYISASPGKDMRSQLIDAFNIWLRVPLESLEIIKQVVAELHNASLL